MPDLLFEIGTEELPPDLIHSLTVQISENIKHALANNYFIVKNEDIKTFNTPRRIAVYIQNIPLQQEIKNIEIKGPPKDKAYDKNGNPTEIAFGFAKKNNLNINELQVKKQNNIDYVYAFAQTGGKKTKDLLPNILAFSLKNTSGEKFMNWGNFDEKFARPIRWICALFNKEVISFKYAGVESNQFTFGHRFLSNKRIEITNEADYENLLEKHFVIVNPEKRKERIIELIDEQSNKISTTPSKSYQLLLNSVVNITEYPSILICQFNKDFLQLPSIIIETVLVKHQKYFTVTDKTNGELLSNFLVITNGTETANKQFISNIIKGNEKVATARLNDAMFFYKEDLKEPFNLEARKKELAKITFQKGLGSMEDKINRIIDLSKNIYLNIIKNSKLSVSLEDIIKTAELCKLDLTTQMVFEFTELQGEIGTIYAKKNNYNDFISNGINEHYYPRFVNDIKPRTDTGLIVGIADKLDNIVSLFLIGKTPTGSTDPFALRRQADGIIENILEKDLSIDIDSLITSLINDITIKIPSLKTDKDTHTKIKFFLTGRFISILEGRAYKTDIINSVTTVTNTLKDITKTTLRINEITQEKDKEYFKKFITAAKRLVRIVDNTVNGNIEQNNFKTNEEKQLLEIFEVLSKKQKNDEFKSTKDFIIELSKLTPIINNFFEKVLVNDSNPDIRRARQSLMNRGKILFENICDFNQLVEN